MKRIFAVLTFACADISLRPLPSGCPRSRGPRITNSPSRPILTQATFEGDETIAIRVLKPTSEITLNAVDIDFHEVTITERRRHAEGDRSRRRKKKRWSC